MSYIPNPERYDKMIYNRCGKSGLKISAVSLGLWQNFGVKDNFDNMQAMIHTAFDLGITHFDLANNYGPTPGTAEENFGRILDKSMRPYRDEMCISSKAGYEMWEGPYGGRHGSRKYLTASLDQSLKRMGLDYVDIFYHHVYDPETPMEETMLALDNAVKQGKALYVGISNYGTEQTKEALKILRELKTPFVLNQPSYSMLNRWIEDEKLVDLAQDEGFGLIAFSPLFQGFLTNKYLNGVPEDSRLGKGNGRWLTDMLTPEMVGRLNKLNDIAHNRGQSLAQMALSWVLRGGKVTSVLIGASRPQQITENVEAIYKSDFTSEELSKITSVIRDFSFKKS